MTVKNLFLFFLMFDVMCCSAVNVDISFARGKWDAEDFQIVATPRIVNTTGSIIQHDDHISNKVPAGLNEKQLLSCDAGLCAMLYKQKISGNFTVSSRMSFDYRMAPLLVIAAPPGKTPDGRFGELREHYEVVIYDEGINIWHHQYKDGKSSWYLMAFSRFPMKKQVIYDLSASVVRKGGKYRLTVECDGKTFGCAMPDGFDADNCYLGIIGCEGVCRFYDFRIRQ